MSSSAGAAAAAQTPSPQPSPPPADREAGEDRPAPVLVDGDPVIWITAGIGPYSPQFRADRISRRLEDIVRDRSLRDPTVTVAEVDGSSELRVDGRLLMVVNSRDAATLGIARASLAQTLAIELERAIRYERLRYAPAQLVRSSIYGLLATAIFGLALWALQRLTRSARVALRRWFAASVMRRGLHPEMLAIGGGRRAIDLSIRGLRVVLIVLAFNFYLTYVLGLFPWTRAISTRLLDYLLTPFRTIGIAFVAYLPKLLFVIVIGAVVWVAIRIVGLIFGRIQEGRLVFASFPAEWADPTNKIVRILLIAFGVVVAFPYLPASDSPAFAGVSVFIGVLVSLASSSALSNMIAGLVLTYTGAFRIGDRVKLGEAFGDIVETSLLATRVRTIKNEEITIPNSLALGSTVTNYTRTARTLGLILHSTVSIGYDVPWRKVHDVLIEAALATPGVLQDPRPFVWQTALNDFYVTYEINAYSATPRDMIDIYAALHSRIQDAFFAAGIEIMSPHYTALRDGNAVAIPEPLRQPGYEAPAFRVEDAGSGQQAGTRRSG